MRHWNFLSKNNTIHGNTFRFSLALSGCGKETAGEEVPALTDRAVLHETEFGGVYIAASTDEFSALGYKFGDSVDIRFSNGYTLDDQPYYFVPGEAYRRPDRHDGA